MNFLLSRPKESAVMSAASSDGLACEPAYVRQPFQAGSYAKILLTKYKQWGLLSVTKSMYGLITVCLEVTLISCSVQFLSLLVMRRKLHKIEEMVVHLSIATD